MVNFIFGHPDLDIQALHNMHMAQQEALNRQNWAGRGSQGAFTLHFPGGFIHAQPPYREPEAVDLVEIDGVWQVPPEESNAS